MSKPFIIFALPRSRTAWLSRFLTYGEWHCYHEQARYIRSLDDVRLWLSQDCTGTAETAAPRWWRLARHYCPEVTMLVVRRPVDEVVESLMALDLSGVAKFNRGALETNIARLDRSLDAIERHTNAMSVSFADLKDESVCAQVFEHCLPYHHDHEWWASLTERNLQIDMRAMMRYAITYIAQLEQAGKICKRKIREISRPYRQMAEPDDDGMVIQEESFDVFMRDCMPLLAEHSRAVGEPEGEHLRKNWDLISRLDQVGAWHIVTARCNGKIFGYLASIVGPSLESPDRITATQTIFYSSRDAGINVGLKLQRASIDRLRSRGVGEIIMRAGVRGAGPKLGVLYHRVGAEDFGQMFRLTLAGE